jgi:hypothetical protein
MQNPYQDIQTTPKKVGSSYTKNAECKHRAMQANQI